MKDLLRNFKPEVFRDLIALNALYRPGPLKSGMTDEFIHRKNHPERTTYEFPELEPILKETRGIIVYQEQVMRIAGKLAGFSLAEADILRKAMGKKVKDIMKAQKQRFLQGARKNGIAQSKANKIFDQIAQFAEYGFNKSHSAAYAYLAYQTAYLKAHYPRHFLAALLTSEAERGATPQVVKYIGECQRDGDQRPAAGHQPERLPLHGRGRGHPLRPGRRQERRRGGHPRDPGRAREARRRSPRRSTSSRTTTRGSSTARRSRA